MNFKKSTFMDKLPEFLKIEVGGNKKQKENKKESKIFKGNLFAMDFNVPLDRIEKNLIRSATGFLILFVIYCGFASLIKKQIENKNDEAQKSINNTNSQIALVNADIQNIQSKTSKYANKISSLEKISEKVQENNRIKKAIPILLNKLMYIMPDEVQITSIQNTTDTHIEIQAQSKSYAQLGYLTTNLKVSGVLNNVISTAGQQQNNIITIKIEGDLP